MKQTLLDRLNLQADEARKQNLVKLADFVCNAIDETSEKQEYSYSELQEDISKKIWQCVLKVIEYHNHEQSDIVQLNELVENFADTLISDIEDALQIKVAKGELDIKLPGEE